MKEITTETIRKRVSEFVDTGPDTDPEGAHWALDRIYVDALTLIASGRVKDMADFAADVLACEEVGIEKWYA